LSFLPLAVFALLLALMCLASAAPLVLVQNGKPNATIVVQADAPAPLQAAATDLQTYIRKISGVELSMKTDGKTVAGNGLYIGMCEPTRPEDVPAASLNPETYAVRTRGGNVFFTARYPTPAAFAVYSFLEDRLGVRWFAPGDDWEYVPRSTPGELTVEAEDVIKVPETSPRIWSGHQWTQSWKDWNLRNKTVESERVSRRNFQNMMSRIFPPEQYAATHPEYFPLIDGKRWIPPRGALWRPCESNPEVQRIVVEYIRRYFAENPDVDSFSLGMDDIRYLCSCPNCRAMDAHPDDYEKRRFSDRHYKFVQILAREIKQSHPDKFIGTLVYNVARQLPETVPKLDDNVFGFLTEQSALWFHPERKQDDQELSREWRKHLKHLSRYDYYGMGTITPRVYPHFMAEQIKLDKLLGFEGMYTEIYTFLPHTAPMIWAFSKLQWDSRQDIDVLLNEFYSKMYGPAAGTMAKYYQLLEDSWSEPRPDHGGHVFVNLRQQATAISPQAVRDCMALLEIAKREANSEIIERRIEVVRAGLEYSGYVILPYGLSQELAQTPIVSEDAAQAAFAKIREVETLREQRKKFWPAAMQRDDLLGETLRGLASMTKPGRPNGLLEIGQIENIGIESGVAAGSLKLLDFYAERQPEKARELAAQLSTPDASDEQRQAVRAWLWVQQNTPANLLTNGDFEGASNARGIPAKWTGFSSGNKAEFAPVLSAGRSNSAAISVTKNIGNAVLYQKIAVEPGQKYLCRIWFRSDAALNAARGILSFSFEPHAGEAPNPRSAGEIVTSGTAEWQPLTMLITVPEKMAQLVIKAGARSGGETAADGKFYLDDVALYRLPAEF
jgi:hypothetical protein